MHKSMIFHRCIKWNTVGYTLFFNIKNIILSKSKRKKNYIQLIEETIRTAVQSIYKEIIMIIIMIKIMIIMIKNNDNNDNNNDKNNDNNDKK